MSDSEERMTEKGPAFPGWLIRAITAVHLLLRKLSGGKLFNTLGGDEVCFVNMKGAKSGRNLTIPLMYVPYNAGVLLVASKAGAAKNPVWYYNLVKNPDIEVTHRGRNMHLHARLAAADEKDALWPICEEHYEPFADYRSRTHRDIPIFICEPSA